MKIKKRLNKFNFYIYYIKVLNQLAAIFEDINNKNISIIHYNALLQNDIFFHKTNSEFIRLNSEL